MSRIKKKRNRKIVERALSGETYSEIAADYGVTRQRVQQIAKRAGVPPRGPVSGPEHHRWNGGRFEAGRYVRVRAPKHPRADGHGYVAEHVLAAEKKIGRSVGPDEHVHHINGDPRDNRPENLRVMPAGEHIRHHLLYWTRERLLAALRWVSLRVGRTATQLDLNDRGVYHSHLCDRFGSLSNAQRQAGLAPNSPGRPPKALPAGFRKKHENLLEFESVGELAESLERQVS